MVSANRSLMNAFTVDLEDWYQGLTSTNPQVERWPAFESRVVDATRRLLALLRDHDVQATFFVLGYVADRHPDLVAEVADAGHEIGVHGYYHRFVYKLTPDEFAAELDNCMAALERITGAQPQGHRAPYFSINAKTGWAFEILASRGFIYDSSVFPTRNMLYGFPGAPRFPYGIEGTPMIEFPATTLRWAGVNWPVAGGFYNRLLPYRIIETGVRQANAQGQPAILYIHPWELDTEQRYGEVTLRERITHYHGRRQLANKLHRLFETFRFGPLGSLLAQTAPALSVSSAAEGAIRR